MRLGNTLKGPRPYCLPARDTMDVVGSSDLSSLLTAVRGVNPFDVSPGIQLILEKLEMRPKSANPYVQYTNTLDMDKDTIGTITDERENTALHIAAGCGYTQVVEALLDECGASLESVNADGFTALHVAVMNGHLECAHRLCSAGASVKEIVQYDAPETAFPFLRGRTPLFLAHWHQHSALESLLRSFGADTIRGASSDGYNFWQNAAAGHDVAVFAYLFDVLDCQGSAAVHPLELPLITEPLPALLEAMPMVLSHLVPPHSQMSAAQMFIFEGLVSRGIVEAGSTIAISNGESATTVLDRILVAGHTNAFRAIKIDVARCDPPLSLRVCTHGDSEESHRLLLLIQEAEARDRASCALAAYQKHMRNKRLKRAAMTESQTWLELKQTLASQGVPPLAQ